MAARIGIDYTAAVQQAAGIGRYSRELVKALAALSPQKEALEYRLFVASAGRVSLPALPGPNFAWRPTRLTERWLARLWYRLHLPLWIQTWTGPLDLFHATDFFCRRSSQAHAPWSRYMTSLLSASRKRPCQG